MKTCYYCGKKATSKEHIPPRCLFPARTKVDYRKNLITVYSCNEHNTEKSNDDEYLFLMLMFNINQNNIPIDEHIEKLNSIIDKKGNSIKTFFKNPKNVFVRDPTNGLIVPTMQFQFDADRYDKIIKQIGIGLYYFTYRKLFSGTLTLVYNGALFEDRPDLNAELRRIMNTASSLMANIEYAGNNQEIFKYKILKGTNIFLKIVFFERNEILLRFIENI